MADKRTFTWFVFVLFAYVGISTARLNSNRVIDCFYVENRTDSIGLVCNSTGTGNGNATKPNECWTKLFATNDRQYRYRVNQITTGNCMGAKLNDQFLSQFQQIRVLNVSFYGMQQFQITYKASVRNLKTLNATHNNLQQIKTIDLRPLHELIVADFSFNEIQIIEPIPCHKLNTLNLSHNNVSSIESEALWYLSQIKVLDLSENHIETIPSDLFERNKDLEILCLQNNLLKHFQVMGNLTKIRWLNVASNRLLYALKLLPQLGESLERLELACNFAGPLNCTHFERFKNLKFLNLNNSNVTQIEADTFDQQARLEVLDLSNNQLQHFNFTSIRNAKFCELNLNGNRIANDEVNQIAMHFPKMKSKNSEYLRQSSIVNGQMNHSIKILQKNPSQRETAQTEIKLATISQKSQPETTMKLGWILTWTIMAFGSIAMIIVITIAWRTHAKRQNEQQSEHCTLDASDCFEYYCTENKHDSAFD